MVERESPTPDKTAVLSDDTISLAMAALLPGYRLDFTESYLPRPDEAINVGRVRERVTSEVLGEIASIKNYRAPKTGERIYLLAEAGGRLTPEVVDDITDLLHLDPTHTDHHRFIQSVGRDLYAWTQRGQADGYNLEIDTGDRIILRCPARRAVLPLIGDAIHHD